MLAIGSLLMSADVGGQQIVTQHMANWAAGGFG